MFNSHNYVDLRDEEVLPQMFDVVVVDFVFRSFLVRLNESIVETFLINVRIIIDEDERNNNNYH